MIKKNVQTPNFWTQVQKYVNANAWKHFFQKEHSLPIFLASQMRSVKGGLDGVSFSLPYSHTHTDTLPPLPRYLTHMRSAPIKTCSNFSGMHRWQPATSFVCWTKLSINQNRNLCNMLLFWNTAASKNYRDIQSEVWHQLHVECGSLAVYFG